MTPTNQVATNQSQIAGAERVEFGGYFRRFDGGCGGRGRASRCCQTTSAWRASRWFGVVRVETAATGAATGPEQFVNSPGHRGPESAHDAAPAHHSMTSGRGLGPETSRLQRLS